VTVRVQSSLTSIFATLLFASCFLLCGQEAISLFSFWRLGTVLLLALQTDRSVFNATIALRSTPVLELPGGMGGGAWGEFSLTTYRRP